MNTPRQAEQTIQGRSLKVPDFPQNENGRSVVQLAKLVTGL
jgi:hypothetical protein